MHIGDANLAGLNLLTHMCVLQAVETCFGQNVCFCMLSLVDEREVHVSIQLLAVAPTVPDRLGNML